MTWHLFSTDRPPFGVDLDVTVTIEGMGNTLYRTTGTFTADGKFLTVSGPEFLGRATPRHWCIAEPMPNNGLWEGPKEV